MTREEIEAKWEAMTPRERDAWIAEVLFGWYRIKGPKTDYDGLCEYGDVLIPPNITIEEAFSLMPPRGAIPFTYFVNRKWSADILAAWEVEEVFKSDSAKQAAYAKCLKDVLGDNAYMFDFIHATPEQRCKAALLVMEGCA